MTLYGSDTLGILYYTSAAIKAHPKGWAGGIMPETFTKKNAKGKVTKGWGALKKMMKSGKYSEIVVHLTAFDYTHAYQIKKHEKLVYANTTRCQKLQKQFPETKLLLSPFCENHHDRKTLEPVFNKMRSLAPDCLLVNSTMNHVEVPGVITEIHITKRSKLPKKPKGEYTVSFDGFGGDGSGDFTDTDIESILNFYFDARHIRWWNFRCNGKYGNKDTTPLANRKHWPDENYLRGHYAMMKTREGNKTWKDNSLLKPFADDHGTGGKDNKLMCILPIKKKSVNVFDLHGNVIDVMKIPAPPLDPNHAGDPKGYRFYSSKYAYQVADLAEKNTGSRQIKIDDSPYTDGDLRSGRFK